MWSKFLDRLKRQGPAWIWRRLRFEWMTPTTGPGRTWLRARLRARAAWRYLVRQFGGAGGVPTSDDTLYTFYDLQVAPITFDVLWFMAAAELRRRECGLRRIAVMIVPGRERGLRAEDPAYEAVVEPNERRTRIDTVLLQALSLSPEIESAVLAKDRAEAAALRRAARHVYPALYDVALPSAHEPPEVMDAARQGRLAQRLRAPEDFRNWVARWIAANAGERRLVTVTLRQYGYRQSRNSDIGAWGQFARGLDPARYAVAVVPDTAESGKPMPEEFRGCLYLPETALDVRLRLALYEAAFVNLGVNCGPLHMSLFTERPVRCLMFKLLPEDPEYAAEAWPYMRALGFVAGETPPNSRPGQKWVWRPDTYPVITGEFEALVAEIEAGRA